MKERPFSNLPENPQMLKDFFKSFTDCFRALGFVFENRMAHYFLYPVIITVLLSIGLVSSIEWAVDSIQEWVQTKYLFMPSEIADEAWMDTARRWLQEFSDFAIQNVLKVVLYVAFYFLFHKAIKYIVLVLMSPVMSLISERTDEVLTGREFPFDWPQLFKDVLRGIRIAIRNFAIEMGIILGVWILTIAVSMLLPFLAIIIAPVGAIFTWLIGAYFYGFATMDYTNERRRLKVKESVQFIRANKGIALGNGVVFTLLMIIPIIGAYIGPVFATVMCTVGAVLSIHDKVNLDRDDFFLKPTTEEGVIPKDPSS